MNKMNSGCFEQTNIEIMDDSGRPSTLFLTDAPECNKFDN
ncbi:2555_t:CDS:2 [Funneliformis mosseae]|uniref:2555_t:CDS:1 n=1 Tax=Funneliformis mosseae TaxID=27381 RepID=A0A9N9NBL9_FUNMO|nr:2555_t:CDS:2 [Funneliformis mosseae]